MIEYISFAPHAIIQNVVSYVEVDLCLLVVFFFFLSREKEKINTSGNKEVSKERYFMLCMDIYLECMCARHYLIALIFSIFPYCFYITLSVSWSYIYQLTSFTKNFQKKKQHCIIFQCFISEQSKKDLL